MSDEKEYITALIIKAKAGNSNAQYRLGYAYLVGEGIGRNYQEAFKWLTKAAAKGNMDAQYNLGVMYYEGNGVKQNYKESRKWFNLSRKKEQQLRILTWEKCLCMGKGYGKL